MADSAPLQITVEITFEDGPAARQRRFRLSRQVMLPPALAFDGSLPIDGQARGRVDFNLPEGQRIRAAAMLRHDPAHPGMGSSAELLDLESEQVQAILSYIETHTR